MFVNAIEKATEFTRPIHSIFRNYGSTEILSGTSTLFIINEEGYALTCKHVVENFIQLTNKINNNYSNFKSEKNALTLSGNKLRKAIKELEDKYGYKNDITIQVFSSFINCVDHFNDIKFITHPLYDLAILKFEGFSSLNCNHFPVFLKDSSLIKQGKSLCRLGFPFPEFNNFQYNNLTDDIEWTSTGILSSPFFPIDGIVTRHIANNGQIYGIELSTPGLKGQSGGPLFDIDGKIYGMQFATNSLYLGFDIINKEIVVDNKKKKISDYSFIHLGQCIHVDILKDFLKNNNIKFNEQ